MQIFKITGINESETKEKERCYWIYFKDVQTNKIYKSRIVESFKNYKNWEDIIDLFKKNKEIYLKDLSVKGVYIHGDSVPKII